MGDSTSIIFVPRKFLLCVVTKRVFLCDRHIFVVTNIVATKHVFCHDNGMLVVTKLLSRQTHVCHDKYLSQQKYACHDKTSVVTKLCLSRQTFCHGRHTCVATEDVFCQDKAFVATKLMLVAVPASDTKQQEHFRHASYRHSFKHSAQRHPSQK